MDTHIISGFVYVVITIFFGLYYSRGTSADEEDFFLANRGIGKFAGALSASASSESAWVIMGLAGAAYMSGLSVFWLIPGCALGYSVNWFILAPKFNTLSRKHDAVTIPELLGKLSGSQGLKIILSIIIGGLMLAYVAAQFLALGKVLSQQAGLDPTLSIVIGGIIVGLYVSFGGLKASIFSDVLQSLLMLVALIIVPVYSLIIADFSFPENDLNPNYYDFMGNSDGVYAAVGLILGWSGIGLGYPGQPHVHNRYFAMKNPTEIKTAGIIAIIWSTMVFVGAITVGIVGRGLIPDLDANTSELILIKLSYTYLSPLIGGVVIAAILAAIASTADSQLLVVSATIKNDIGWFKKSKLNSKIITISIAVIGAYLASTNNSTIFDMVLYAWDLLGVTVGIAVIGILVFNNSATAVFVAMGAGVFTLLAWKHLGDFSTNIYALVPAMIVSLSILWIFKRKS